MSALRSLIIVVLDLDKVQRWTYARKVNSLCILSIFTNSCKLEANISVVQFTQIKIVEFQFDKTFHMNEMFQNKTARIQREQESVNKTAAASGQPNKTESAVVYCLLE